MRAVGPRTILATAFALAALAVPARAATFTVEATSDAVDAAPGDGLCATSEGACTLRAAVMEANALAGADEVVVPAGDYLLSLAGADENEAVSGDLDLQGDVTIGGAGMDLTIVRGDGTDRIFDVHAPATVTISGLTMRDGGGVTNGGGVRSREGDLALDGVRITAVQASEAGVAIVATGPLRIVNSDLDGTDSGGSIDLGGAIRTFDALVVEASRIANWSEHTTLSASAAVTIADTTVERNRGRWFVFGASPLDIRGSTFRGNSNQIFIAESGPATIEDSGFLANLDCTILVPKPRERTAILRSRFEDNACAVADHPFSISDADVEIRETLIARNSPPAGVADGKWTFSLDRFGSLLLDGVTVLDNRGGLYARANYGITVRNSRFEGNVGRGLFVSDGGLGGIVVEDSVFTGNELGLHVSTASHPESIGTIRGVEISGNGKKAGGLLSAAEAGGLSIGCDANSETVGIRVVRSRIVGNSSERGAAVRGGSSEVLCPLRIVESEIRANAATTASITSGRYAAEFERSLLDGNITTDGADIDVDGSVTLRNTTWTESGPDPSPFLFVREGRTASIEYSTLAQFTASSTPIVEVDGDVTVTGSILYDRGIGCDGLRVLASGGYNLVLAANCGLADASDLLGVDPLLGTLADRGGPTETFALLEGSPAIGAIPAEFCPETDQRGWRRVGDACAVGAFEPEAVPCTDADGDGYAVEGDLCGAWDCDDADPDVSPGAAEIPGNAVDDDCDPLTPAACTFEVPVAEAAMGAQARGARRVDLSFALVAVLAGGIALRRRRSRA